MVNTQRQVIIAGNWKMHKTRAEGKELARAIKAEVAKQTDLPEIVLIPPFTCLEDVGSTIEGSGITLGAQNMDYRDSGAFTGEVSPVMLTDLKVKYVLIGHSERRQFFGETNATTNLRVRAAIAHKLKPILCVGESLDERESGLTDAVVSRQVAAALADVPQVDWQNLTIAYEPVWAIGTGKNCEAKEANRVCTLIKTTLTSVHARTESKGGEAPREFHPESIPILYGGSVKPSNIEEQLNEINIDGALVGGASLKADEFIALIKAGQKRVQGKLGKAPAALKGN